MNNGVGTPGRLWKVIGATTYWLTSAAIGAHEGHQEYCYRMREMRSIYNFPSLSPVEQREKISYAIGDGIMYGITHVIAWPLIFAHQWAAARERKRLQESGQAHEGPWGLRY